LRAYIHEKKEFYFAPKGKDYESLSEFWAVVRGYNEKGLKVSVDRPTGVLDMNEKMIYENDYCSFVYYYHVTGKHETRNGQVKYSNGCFLIVGMYGWYETLWKDPDINFGYKYKIKIIGNKYESKIVPF
jgi:hypothetical protein